jgi:hypothetical protein
VTSDLRFYLGTHRAHWLWTVHDVPLFISHRVLLERKTPFPRATTPWALDSGGFTELNLHGKWETTPEEYVTAVRRYDDPARTPRMGLPPGLDVRADGAHQDWSHRDRTPG